MRHEIQAADHGLIARCCHDFFADESGATAIEYGVLAVGLALVIITGISSVGSSLSSLFTNVSNSF